MTESNELEIAHKCTESMHERDYMAQSSGMTPVSKAPGESVVTMKIDKNMLNGLASCHGGMIFALADTAFAHACNNRNEANVAMDCRIDFLAPGFEGDELTAMAKETHKGGKSSLYEVTVSNQDGKNIAFFTGRSYRVNRTVI